MRITEEKTEDNLIVNAITFILYSILMLSLIHFAPEIYITFTLRNIFIILYILPLLIYLFYLSKIND